MTDPEYSVTVDNEKYTVLFKDGEMEALRYGEEWRKLTGDNLIFYLMVELNAAREAIGAAKNCLVCSCIADPSEVCENTLGILTNYDKE